MTSGKILILSDTISLFAKWTQYVAHKIAMRLKLYYLLKGLSSVSAEYEPLNKSIPLLSPALPQSPHHGIPSQAYIVQNKGTLIQLSTFRRPQRQKSEGKIFSFHGSQSQQSSGNMQWETIVLPDEKQTHRQALKLCEVASVLHVKKGARVPFLWMCGMRIFVFTLAQVFPAIRRLF